MSEGLLPPADGRDADQNLSASRRPVSKELKVVDQSAYAIPLREDSKPQPRTGLWGVYDALMFAIAGLCMAGGEYVVHYLKERKSKNENLDAQKVLFEEQTKSSYEARHREREKHAVEMAERLMRLKSAQEEAATDPKSIQKQDVAEEAKKSTDTAREVLSEEALRQMLTHLKGLAAEGVRLTPKLDELAPRKHVPFDPVRELQRRDLKELITRGLSRAERLIIILYYFEEQSFAEIGATLEIPQKRVEEMHSKILLRLKNAIADRRAKPRGDSTT